MLFWFNVLRRYAINPEKYKRRSDVETYLFMFHTVSLILPGNHKTGGFWPGVWAFGNLGRAGEYRNISQAMGNTLC
jgi:hypothetical protein